MYGLLGYRIPGINVMPIFIPQYYEAVAELGNPVVVKTKVWVFGLNWQALDAVTVKAEYHEVDRAHGLKLFYTQVAWAF